jgi:hypothetical protein
MIHGSNMSSTSPRDIHDTTAMAHGKAVGSSNLPSPWIIASSLRTRNTVSISSANIGIVRGGDDGTARCHGWLVQPKLLLIACKVVGMGSQTELVSSGRPVSNGRSRYLL